MASKKLKKYLQSLPYASSVVFIFLYLIFLLVAIYITNQLIKKRQELTQKSRAEQELETVHSVGPAKFESNALLIKISKEAKGRFKSGNPQDTGLSRFDEINKEENISRFEPLVTPGRNDDPEADIFRWYKVDLPGNQVVIEGNLDKITAKLTSSHPAAQALQRLIDKYANDPDVEALQPDYILYPLLIPNDPKYPNQWHLPKTNAPSGWDKTVGSGVVIADIDTGVDLMHEDLVNNLWTNEDEIPNNGIDDDNNGYIDDIHGYDFYVNDNDPTDNCGHGTMTSGIAAAVGNNSTGVAGLNWNAKIMALKTFAGDNTGSCVGGTSSAYKAFYYAVKNGAKVTTNSWESSGRCLNYCGINDAITYAHQNGVVTVAAAGNSGADAFDSTPAAADRVIAVSATDANDLRPSWSNWGEKIDVAAPGTSVWTTFPPYIGGHNIKYVGGGGTSFSAPQVAGLAALLLAKDPTLQPEEIRQLIRLGATDLGPTGKDKDFGYGRIDVNKTLSLSPGQLLTPIITYPVGKATIGLCVPLMSDWCPGQTDPILSIKGSIGGQNFSRYQVEFGAGREPTTWMTINASTQQVINGTLATFDTRQLPNGVYIIRLTAFDKNGQSYMFQIGDVTINYVAPTPTNTPTPTLPPDTTPPAVTINSPVNNSLVNVNTSLRMTATAIDNRAISQVIFTVDRDRRYSCRASLEAGSTYICNWTVPKRKNVVYTISTTAYDAAQNSTVSSVKVTSK